MMNSGFKSGPIVAVLAVAALLAAYVGGYFALSEWHDASIYIREFGTRWQASLFRPLVHVESACVGRMIVLSGGGEVVAHVSGFATTYPP